MSGQEEAKRSEALCGTDGSTQPPVLQTIDDDDYEARDDTWGSPWGPVLALTSHIPGCGAAAGPVSPCGWF